MSQPINLLITLPFDEEVLIPLKEVSPRLKITVRKARSAADIPDEIWQQTEILYTGSVLPDPLKAPHLEWIQFHWAGIDRHAEAPILHKSGLRATTLSGAHAPQMGEYILMMLLALGHRLLDMQAAQARKEWPTDRWERYIPRELSGSTVGIIGYGSIGRQVARLLQPFNARVLAVKRDAMQPQDPDFSLPGTGDPQGDLVHRIYPPQALRSMLRECDFVVVAVPLTAETTGLLGQDEFNAIKPGAYLVDVSRGGVIDHTALISALKDKRLAGAALDVYPEEPLPEKSPLWKLPNLILTPHISGITSQYDRRAMVLFAENLRQYLAEKPLLNIYDRDKGY